MKIRSLHLEPYGSFQSVELSLAAGVTVVYGPNEAGKTTLLNAYTDLLCGIHRQTKMVAVASRAKLRIHATLELADGSVLNLTRNPFSAPNDLVDVGTGRPILPEWWASRLGALDRDALMSRFGIDHARLVKGGNALMQGGGDLAALVFEARTGDGLRELIGVLESRLDELYNPHGNSKSRLGEAIAKLADLQQALKDTIATAEVVERARGARDGAGDNERAAKRQLSAARGEGGRLEALVGSWEHWLEYQRCTRDLEGLAGEGSALSDAQLATFDAAEGRLAAIVGEISAASGRAHEARIKRQRLEIDEPLLHHLPAVKTIESGRVAAKEARERAADRRSDIQDVRTALSSSVARLGGDSALDPVTALRALSVAPDRAADLHELARGYSDLQKDLKQARCNAAESDTALAAAEHELAANAEVIAPVADLSVIEPERQARDGLWRYVRAAWLDGVEPPAQVAEGASSLAQHYETAVKEVDQLMDGLLVDVGKLGSQERAAIEGFASARATVRERRAAAGRAAHAQKLATEEMALWQERWDGFLRASPLPIGLGAAGWVERSNLLREADAELQKLTDLGAEVDRCTDRFQAWDAQVTGLARALDRAVDVNYLDAWFNGIKANADSSESNRNLSGEYQQQEAEAEEQSEDLVAEQQACEGQLSALAAEHGIDRAGLSTLASRACRRLSLYEELERPTVLLRARHPDIGFTELVETFQGWRKPDLDAEIVSAEASLLELERVFEHAQGARIEAQKSLDALLARTGEQELNQQLAQTAAEVEDIVQQWALARIKLHLLKVELKVYFESHGNPVIERAGCYLERLTDGRFVALRVDTNGPMPALIVKGANEDDYATDELSDGTCTQLFLALRLAGAVAVQEERSRAGLETLPLILDDVLMAFDDTRSRLALSLLAEIGANLQIIVLTHHDAVTGAAAKLEGQVKVCQLSAPLPMQAVASPADIRRRAGLSIAWDAEMRESGPTSETRAAAAGRVCANCGAAIDMTGRRGRPPKLCDHCRA